MTRDKERISFYATEKLDKDGLYFNSPFRKEAEKRAVKLNIEKSKKKE